MVRRLKKIAVMLLPVFLLTGCDQFEMRGFFVSYESADQRYEESMNWNEAHPFRQIDVLTDNYEIFAMGDSHVGGTDNLDFFLEEAISTGALGAVMVGDMTTGHSEDYKVFEEHLPDQDILATFPVVGNHDLYFDGWKQYYKFFGSSTYLFTVNTPEAKDLYICLDSGSGTFGAKQLKWLRGILQSQRDEYRYCILFTHNNLFRIRHTASTNPFAEEIFVLMEMCIAYEIDMVVTGHDHEKNEVVHGNTTHITMDALLDDFKDAGYFKIKVDQGTLEHEFVNL